MKRLATFALCALTAAAASAGPLALPPAPRADFRQNVGAALPLDRRFVDDSGTAVQLGQLLGGRPAVLVFGYYRCPMLCGVVGAGVLDALRRAQATPDSVALIEVGIDPTETPADAAQKKAEYARTFGAAAERAHLLTGSQPAIDAVAAAAGFSYTYDAARGQFAHPAGFLLVTPQGRISQYFLGVRFDAAALRTALDRAAENRTGSVLERLLLLCAHYDPALGRHSLAAMTSVRIVCVGVCAALGFWIWRRRRARRSGT